MNVSMIAAVAKNGVIGKNGGLPWRIPSDLRWFKNTTQGCPVIMGRKTFESLKMPKGLPGRTNFVLSRENLELGSPEHLTHAISLNNALDKCKEFGLVDKEIFIIGGQSIYEEGMEYANKLYISWVEAEVEGDTYFPEIDLKVWEKVFSSKFPQTNEDDYPFTAVIYKRR